MRRISSAIVAMQRKQVKGRAQQPGLSSSCTLQSQRLLRTQPWRGGLGVVGHFFLVRGTRRGAVVDEAGMSCVQREAIGMCKSDDERDFLVPHRPS